jgi:cysteinyl-tRNA synthetase
MIGLISQLIEAGHAYEVEGDVYFAVRSFAAYGALSGRDIDQLLSGARVDVDERKADALDFALWKAAKPGEPAWDSPWGPGRPGWHIECSAMSQRYLGESFDIHGGGEDLVFPHHENEIAQSQAAGNGFARYWLHGGMLTIDQEKMSKSLGNYLLLKDVLEHVKPEALRLLMLQSHYRSPFDYSAMRLAEAESALQRVENGLRTLDWAARTAPDPAPDPAPDAAPGAEPDVAPGAALLGASAPTASTTPGSPAVALLDKAKSAKARFIEQMDDDFNTAGAVAQVFELISEANQHLAGRIETVDAALAAAAAEAAATIRELLGVLGIALTATGSILPEAIVGVAQELAGYTGSDLEQAAEALLGLRAAARAAKDWQVADAVRDRCRALGLAIEDTANGTRFYMAQDLLTPSDAQGQA